jgi:hypothetical protein
MSAARSGGWQKPKELSRKSVSNICTSAPYFCDIKNVDFPGIDWLSHNSQFSRQPIHVVGYKFLFCRVARTHTTGFTHFLRRADVDFDNLQRADIGFECY